MVTLSDAGHKKRIDSEPKPGPRGRTWTGSTTIGWFSTTASGENRLRIGLAQLERLEGCSRRAPASPDAYRELLSGIEDLDLLCLTRVATVRGWFVYTVALPRGVDRDETNPRLRERACRASRTCRDPPDELHADLRAPARRVSGLRGHRRALARAAVPSRAHESEITRVPTR